jgi:hypothetical protein
LGAVFHGLGGSGGLCGLATGRAIAGMADALMY